MGHVFVSRWLAATALFIVGPGTAGGALSAVLAQESAGSEPAVSAVALAQPAESIAVADDHLVLDGQGCTSARINPLTLAARAVPGSCSGSNSVQVDTLPGAPEVRLRVGFQARGDTIQVERLDPATHRFVVGPVLMTLQNWGWIHSGGVAVGGVSIWIYGGPQLLELSVRSGALEHRFVVHAGFDPLLVAGSTGAWITPGVFGGSECNSLCVNLQ